MDRIAQVMAEPDAVLLREAQSVQMKLVMHTVPLFFFQGAVGASTPRAVGSGVLVAMLGRFFILTAGHCVRDAVGEIAVGITDGPHTFVPRLDRRGHRYSNTEDFGYFEIPPADVGTIAAQRRVFLSDKFIDVFTPHELRAQDDWIVIGGYPDALVTGDKQSKPGMRLLAYSTTIAGLGEAPASTLTAPAVGAECIDLWVPRSGNLNGLTEPPAPIDLPTLQGVSGGGC